MRAGSQGAALAWSVLRAEGVAAFRDRLLDRLAGWRRRRGFRTVAVESHSTKTADTRPLADVEVLNVLATPPRPDLGGVQVQMLRRLAAEAVYRPWALLYPERGGYRLEIEAEGRRRAVALKAPAAPSASLTDEAFEWAVRRAVGLVGARAVHFEQLVGWPLASVAKLRDSGIRQVISVHDFGLFCLRPHLMEKPGLRFCDYCREPRRCARCLSHDWRLEEGFQEKRREVAREVLCAADAVVYPSDFLRRTYDELIAGLEAAKQWVVEPPSVGGAFEATRLEPRPRIRHLAYVGSVKPHKGALVLEELIQRLTAEAYPDLRWSVYGGGDRDILRRLSGLPSVRLRGYYRAGALPGMLHRDGVDLALLLSIWPESYALTLDECLQAGVPVLAFDHGAIADRSRRAGGGTLVSLEAGVEGVARQLSGILDQAPQPAPAGTRFPDGASAAAAMRDVYRDLGLL